ncbi:MAG: hypothetical protein IJY09_04955 [Lachnospiraceae bacterium]|nr:hypothetical protein [Lachnospiraceae bacterium]
MNKKITDVLKNYAIPLVGFGVVAMLGSSLLGSDFGKVMQWWLMLMLLGVAVYPLTGLIFGRFHDGGFVFSKAIGLAITGVLMWYLSSLKLMKFSRVNSLVCVGICAVLSIGLAVFVSSYQKKSDKGVAYLRYQLTQEKLGAALKSEVLYFLFFVFWCYLRGFKPEAYGTEKFMDYGFMTVIDRSSYMPPEDLWLSGESINYYYVGQYLATYLTKLTGVGVAYGYNLMLMTLAAFGFSMPFSIVNNLIRTFLEDRSRKLRTDRSGDGKTVKNGKRVKAVLPAIAGAVAGVAVSMAGNMHFLIYRYLVPFLEKLAGIEEVSSFWFPDSTRYIGYDPDTADKTIHEFPSYSFILGDLHAHVINIMFVLTVLGMLFAWLLYRKEKMDEMRLGHAIQRPSLWQEALHPMVLLLGFFIGLFHMTNFWDFPIYFVVAGAIILFSNAAIYQFSMDTVKLTALQAVLVLLVSKIVSLPFTMNFEQISTEIRLVVYRTPMQQLLILWGIPVILILIYLYDRYTHLYRWGLLNGYTYVDGKRVKKNVAEGIEKKETVEFVPEKNKLYQFIENLQVADLFILTIGLCGIGLVLIPELVYVKDIYSGDYKRANTMFKLTYQSYIMFGMCISYILVKLIGYARSYAQRAAGVAIALCFATTLGYFGNATNGWFGDVTQKERYEGLDASAFVYDESEADAEAIAWLNENIEGTPVVLEAHGDSYTYYQRVSVLTGLPTVLGWRTHEWLWRSDASGGFPEVVSEREDDVCTIYTSEDETEVRYLIEKYDIEYIYVGESERDSEKFKDTSMPVNEELLRSLGEVVFETAPDFNGETTYIVKINR